MANYTGSKIGGTGKLSSAFARNGEPVRILFDVADAVAKNGALASGSTLTLLSIPAHTKVIIDRVYFYTTAELGTAAVEVELGTISNDDEFVASQSTVTAGTEATIVSTMNTVGYTTAAADELRIKLSNSGGTITSGKIWIVLRMFDVSAPTSVAAAF